MQILSPETHDFAALDFKNEKQGVCILAWYQKTNLAVPQFFYIVIFSYCAIQAVLSR